MAKKRKLRSSNPEPTTKTLEPQPPPPPPQDPQIHEEQQQEQPNPENTTLDDSENEEEQVQPLEEQQQQPQTQNAGENNAAADDDNNGNEDEDEGFDDDEEESVEKLLEPFTKEQLHSLVKLAAEKHPGFADEVRRLADVDPAHRKIFVHGLSWDATAESLAAVFRNYGEIEECKVVTDKISGKSKGYAFVLFRRRSAARKALEQPQKKIGNRNTSCQLASAGPVPATAQTVSSEYNQRKIFVSNVSAEIDPRRLLEFFRKFGEVEDGPLGLDKQTGKPKGFALFVYKSVESAKKALEEPNKSFEGYALYCQKAIDGPKGNKWGYQHQQQHSHLHHHHHHQQQQQQPHHQSRNEKNKYFSGGQPSGHPVAPSALAVGFNPGVPAQGLNPALGQALSALLGNQGAGLGLGNLLGGFGGAPMNQPGPPAGYGNQAAVRYGNQPGMQPGYPNSQMGQSSGVRPHLGPGSSYMGQ